MFRNTYQSGLLSIFYSCGSNPLAIWDSEVQNGHIKRLTDNEVNSVVLEIVSTNVATTYITCPKNQKHALGIKLPFLVIIVKNLKRYFSFEITVLDDKNLRRRFRISNFQSTTKIKPFCTTMPIGLSGGWNQIQFNLADFTRRAYGSQYIEALRVQIHANARLRRIYFCDRLYSEEELPQEYKLYLPLERKLKKGKDSEEKKEETKAETKEEPVKPAKSAHSTIVSRKATMAGEAISPTPEEPLELLTEEGKPPASEEPGTPATGEGEQLEVVPEEHAPTPEGEAATAEPQKSETLPEDTHVAPGEAPVEEVEEAPPEAPVEEPGETPIEEAPTESPIEETPAAEAPAEEAPGAEATAE